MSTKEIDTLREILREDCYCLADVGDLTDGFLTVDVKADVPFRDAWTVVTRTPSEKLLRWRYRESRTDDATAYTDIAWERPVYVTEVRREVTVIETSYEVSS
ncbi:hypothetical protein [Rhodococcus erythropolis]|uniref:hypothetical protein n=1 Tax=Rhodococcus erythropolis TaxID=1833 RepID=UPI00366CC264